MNIKKSVTLVLAACAICCLPLAIPLIATIAAGGAGLAILGQVGIGLAIVVIAAIAFNYRRRG